MEKREGMRLGYDILADLICILGGSKKGGT